MTTWDSANKTAGITLSNGNLTAAGSASGNQSVRSTTSKLTGKWYFEVTVGSATADMAIGLVNAAEATPPGGGGLGGDANALGYYPIGAAAGSPQDGIYIGGVFIGANGTSGATGALLGFAVDMTSRKLWVSSTVGRAASKPWNFAAIGTQDPSAAIGGLAFTNPSSALFAAFNDVNNGASCTANFGASAFTLTVPTGYTAWDLPSALTGSAVAASVATATLRGAGRLIGTAAAASVATLTVPAIAVRAVSTGGNNNATSQATPLPTGTTTGDVTILAAIQTVKATLDNFAAGTPPVLTGPSGWTTLLNANGAYIGYRVYVAGDTTTPTLTSTGNGAQYWMSGAISYSGVDTTTPVDTSASCLTIKSTATINRAPSVAPNWAADQLVAIFLDANPGGSTITLPSGYTARQASTLGPAMRICDKVLSTGAQTGVVEATGPVSAGGYLEVGCHIALKTAGASTATADPPAPVIVGSWDIQDSTGSAAFFPLAHLDVRDGDLLVATATGINTITTPTGWTRIASALGSQVFTKTWHTGDATQPVFVAASGNYINLDAVILRRSGTGTGIVTLDTADVGTGLGAAAAPSLARASANEILLVHFGGEDVTARAWSAVTAGLRAENVLATGPNSRFSWLYPSPNPSGGFSATLASSARNDAWAGLFGIASGAGPLTGTAAVAAVVTGTLSTPGVLAGTAAGAAVATATLRGAGQLVGSAIVSSSATLIATTLSPLVGRADAVSSAFATLSGIQAGLVGSAIITSYASATLSARVRSWTPRPGQTLSVTRTDLHTLAAPAALNEARTETLQVPLDRHVLSAGRTV